MNSLPAFQAKLGIPAWDDKLRQWRDNWKSFTHSSGAWTSNKIWTDASSFYPRDGALRVVGWACVAWLPGGWAFIRGTMPPGTTVAGEARAIQEALDRLDPGGVIASDCWAAVCLWFKADRHNADDCTPLWGDQRAYEQHPRHQVSVVKWIPAHRTFQEAIEGGMCYEDWAGNGMADIMAKWAAREGGPSEGLATARAEQRLQTRRF